MRNGPEWYRRIVRIGRGVDDALMTAAEEIESLEREIAAARAENAACGWNRDEDGIYHTGCGHIFVLNDGRLADNEMAFCCYCGLRAEEGELYPETTDEGDA